MTPETEVIACPACKHLLRVPLDWLGTQVQCPECKAMFRAPVRTAGGLTEPELLARPDAAPPAPKKLDAMLLLPAFGLLFCGVTGMVVNAALLYMMLSDPAGGIGWAKGQVEALRKSGFGKVETPEKQAEADERDAVQLVRYYQWILPLALAVSAVVFAGGVSMARRRHYRLAKVACVLAAVNVAHGVLRAGRGGRLVGAAHAELGRRPRTLPAVTLTIQACRRCGRSSHRWRCAGLSLPATRPTVR